VTCGAPNPTQVIINGDFECGTLTPWVVTNQLGGDSETVIPAPSGDPAPGNYALETTSNYYLGDGGNGGTSGATVSQTLNTVPGVTYQVSFDLTIGGGGGNDWSVSVGATTIASGDRGFSGWSTFQGTFTAVTANDVLSIWFQSVQWAYADFYWDNFVVTAI
jgi:hypothetical protein